MCASMRWGACSHGDEQYFKVDVRDYDVVNNPHIYIIYYVYIYGYRMI